MTVRVIEGDCRDVLGTLETASVQCCVTSPPYFALRDYGTARWEGGDEGCAHVARAASLSTRPKGGLDGGTRTVDAGNVMRGDCHCGARRVDSQLGLEPTPAEYVARMVDVFREVRRVLRDDGTLWLNLGDSYAGGTLGRNDMDDTNLARRSAQYSTGRGPGAGPRDKPRARTAPVGLKPKDLVGIPWRVAFALQADGWWLRSEIIWHKPNPMPESVTDRPTKAHEQVFLLTKRERYFYDAEAVAEPVAREWEGGTNGANKVRLLAGTANSNGHDGLRLTAPNDSATRNARTVWTIATQPYSGAHFATMPPELVRRCVLAGTSEAGCCAECRAPLIRETTRGDAVAPTFDPLAITQSGALPDGGVGTHRNMGGRYQAWLDANPKRTVGWRKACECDAGVVPCTVLDPFGGAGTTGLVADRLGRDAVLIELSPSYAQMARERIHSDNPLFTDVA